jgi:non-heme chloroperoxidase
MAGKDAAILFLNHGCQHWRDIIPRITLPTLAIAGGGVSLIPWKSMAWIANQIPDAQLEIFEENEGGSHFMFLENQPSSIRPCQDLSLKSVTRSADVIPPSCTGDR